VDRPAKQLQGFVKCHVSASESYVATCTLGMRDFAYFDVAQRNWHVSGGDYTISVGFSALDLRTTTTVTLPELRIAP
jgi:beta-glucosidase